MFLMARSLQSVAHSLAFLCWAVFVNLSCFHFLHQNAILFTSSVTCFIYSTGAIHILRTHKNRIFLLHLLHLVHFADPSFMLICKSVSLPLCKILLTEVIHKTFILP